MKMMSLAVWNLLSICYSEIEQLWDRFKKAENKGQFKGLSFAEHVADAQLQGFINDQEAEKLLHYNARRYDSMLTDVFDLHLNEVLELENPYIHQGRCYRYRYFSAN